MERMQVLLLSAALILSVSAAQSDDVYCRTPPEVQFASISDAADEKYTLGTTVTYECQFGYTFRGESRTLECIQLDTEDEARWTEPQFSCLPQSCGDPGSINNGRRIGSLFTFPNFVKYECDDGYKLSGLSTRYCQTSGSWSGKLPRCEEVFCEPPGDLANGQVTYNSLEYGSELRFKCDEGFRLRNDETVFCTSYGHWSKTDVECIESTCDIPLKPEHGFVQLSNTGDRPLTGSIAIFSCREDKIIDGPTTSKCLENGQWTFPPPKCLDPCSIPYVTEGVVGRYEKKHHYSRTKSFKQAQLGSRVNDDEELFLRCSEGYEASGSDKREEKISCRLGKWLQKPHCEPAFCRSHPPSAENAEIVTINPEHGGHVSYRCLPGFRKIKDEALICDFGVWKGTTPICKSTSCSVDELQFPGLLKGRKSSYRDGEVFEIVCETGYRVANAGQLKCEDGNWKGALPPCVAASCTQPPPRVNFAKAEVSSMVHSSVAKYICEEPYVLVENSRVQCLFGEWKGQLPRCEDSRCYLRHLQRSSHVSSDSPSVINSGDQLNVICTEGYSPKAEKPFCQNGKWMNNDESPCKEDDCLVPRVNYGDVIEEYVGGYKNWYSYEREVIQELIAPGSIASPGTQYKLNCKSGHSFQGTSLRKRKITCVMGKWRPHPICLPIGTPFVPTTSAPRTLSRSSLSSVATSVVTSVSSASSTTSGPSLKGILDKMTTTESGPELEECSCEYPIDDENLVAAVDGKRLAFLDRVKDESVVVLRCDPVGVHFFNGPRKVKCENCQEWHASDFPTCTRPERGDAVILHGEDIDVSEEGNLEVRRGQSLKLRCVAMESDVYPHWRVPSDDGVREVQERNDRKTYGDVLYESHLYIENADFGNEGPYGCAVGNNTVNIVHIIVIDPNVQCPAFLEESGISVKYDMERRVKNKAFFSCTNQGQELEGKAVLTCLKSGKWSDPPPRCRDIRCKELKGSDMLEIHYPGDREVGTLATFHCFSPAVRSGVSFATCLENGSWSDPAPTCRTPPCSVEELSSALSQNVVAVMDDDIGSTLPHKAVVKLMCAEDLIVLGHPEAECLTNGTWKIPSLQCIHGCPPIQKSYESKLIVKPEKDVYKLGELITFSCLPGMKLNTESQLIMCLKNGWYGAEIILPECEEDKDYNSYEDSEQSTEHIVLS